MSLDVYLNDPTATYETDYLFWANITHNLGKMASKAGIYKSLWRPEEIDKTTAGEIVDALTLGLIKLKSRPDYFKKYSAENGWGTYEQFIPWVERYLEACKEYPDAKITVSR